MKLIIRVGVAMALLFSFGGAKQTAVADHLHGLVSTWVDPATGNVLIDPRGLNVSGWIIRSVDNIFTGAPANIDPQTPFVTTDNDKEVSTGFISLTGTNDLGNIIGQEYLNRPVDF